MPIEKKVQTSQNKLETQIKSYIYDIIAAIIIVSIIAASLNAIGLVDFTETGIWEFLIEWLPYFMAATLLNDDLYKKGAFKGKLTKEYTDMRSYYSNIVTNLTGEQIKGLYKFCEDYNNNALKTIQTEMLKKEGLVYDDFINTYSKLSKQELKKDLNKEQVKCILNTKKAKIKGLTVNQLLSSLNVKDPTNIGRNEIELSNKYKLHSTIKYIISTFVLSLLAINDIRTWGWAAAILVTFKVLYVFARCYMSYFAGFNDITIRLTSHLGRKTDILKMYINDDVEFEKLVNKVDENVENKVDI